MYGFEDHTSTLYIALLCTFSIISVLDPQIYCGPQMMLAYSNAGWIYDVYKLRNVLC